MVLERADIAVWIGTFMLSLMRIGALVSIAPVFGSRLVPRRIRVLLALALTWVIVPLIPPSSALEPMSSEGLLIAGQQLLIGFTMGFMLRLALTTLELGGQIIGMQMGLGFANLLDPQSGNQVPLLASFYNAIGVLVFLSLNGHLLLLQMLIESFTMLPLSAVGLDPAAFWNVINWASHMFAGAVLIALPAVASLLIVNLTFGVMTRAAPQLNIFMVGFPISLILGLPILIYNLPGLLPQLERLIQSALLAGREILVHGGP